MPWGSNGSDLGEWNRSILSSHESPPISTHYFSSLWIPLQLFDIVTIPERATCLNIDYRKN